MGRLRHVTVPVEELRIEESEKKGFGKLDGSSIKGFMEINESDMVLIPIMKTLRKIPWEADTARVLCEIHRGGGEGRFEKDLRAIAENAERHHQARCTACRCGLQKA